MKKIKYIKKFSLVKLLCKQFWKRAVRFKFRLASSCLGAAVFDFSSAAGQMPTTQNESEL